MAVSRNSAPQDDNDFNIDDIYTSLEDAREEVWRRWNDKVLRAKVEEVLGGDIPEVFRDMPRAVLARHILSPNFETFHFLEKAMSINLKPLCLEYLADKFVSVNKDKYFLGNLFFFNGIGKNGGRRLSSLKIIDFNKADGKKLYDVQTMNGENFIQLHHKITENFQFEDIERFDISNFFKKNGTYARNYYYHYLVLFVCFGILFENFIEEEDYALITKCILIPNYKKVIHDFGVKPLIVRIVKKEQENDLYWRYYPEDVKYIL